MRKFEIRYNDGVFYGEITFNDSCDNESIEKFLKQEIDSNNKNPNKNYHISRKNIIEIK